MRYIQSFDKETSLKKAHLLKLEDERVTVQFTCRKQVIRMSG